MPHTFALTDTYGIGQAPGSRLKDQAEVLQKSPFRAEKISDDHIVSQGGSDVVGNNNSRQQLEWDLQVFAVESALEGLVYHAKCRGR